MIDVVTMRFGSKYGPHYLRAWVAGVQRNITVPHRLVCFTDDMVPGLPTVMQVQVQDLGGWWNHLWAFSAWSDNRQLLIDVDDVIVGSLDDLASYDGPHALNSDVYQLENVDGGCQLIPAEPNLALFAEFMDDPKLVRANYYSDKQFYIARINDAPRIQDLFPGQWVSYKVHCQGKGLPAGARIVGFHGEPKPHEVADAWVKDHWLDGA